MDENWIVDLTDPLHPKVRTTDNEPVVSFGNQARWQGMQKILQRAYLIAAVPNLLAACGSALWVINNLHNYRSEMWADFATAAEKDLRAALAKAKGTPPPQRNEEE